MIQWSVHCASHRNLKIGRTPSNVRQRTCEPISTASDEPGAIVRVVSVAPAWNRTRPVRFALRPADRDAIVAKVMILACASCDSRYDVTGYEVGQRFRCRCGAVTTLEAPRSEAGLLACPRCGAGVAPTHAHCDFCRSELLLKACPRCLSRVFHGHKHCPECGSQLDHAAHGDAHTDAPCPRCDAPLAPRAVGDIVIDECRACHGVFLDRTAVERVVTDRRQARAEALLGALPRGEAPVASQRMYVKCPLCKTVMNRKQFALGARTIVDVCRAHGTFFDAGELPRIIDFVMQGGLEQAERLEIERMRDEVKRERQSAQYAAIVDARVSSQAGSGAYRSSSADAVVRLLASLLR